MIRATAGTWVNYMTTVLFQILFAARFGAGHNAAAFVVTFGIGIAVSSVLVSSIRAVVLPRVIAPDGGLLSGSLRFLSILAAFALLAGLALMVLSAPIAVLLGKSSHLDEHLLTDLLRITAAFLFLEFVSGELSAIALARGRRLIPSIAPAFPSVMACIPLVVAATPDVRAVYIYLVSGSLLQVGFLCTSLTRTARVRPGNIGQLGRATVFMLVVFTLLTLIPPVERLVASAHSPADSAQYDYAMRSLRAVQQLVVGGLLLAAVGRWSVQISTGSLVEVRRSFAASVGVACVLLLGAASVGAVSVHGLVHVVFQHGSFTPHDADAVSWVVLLSLPGFCAEGIGLVVTSVLVGLKRNRTLAVVGVTNFVIRLGLIGLWGSRYGAPGLAVAYSIGSLVMLGVLLAVGYRAGLWERSQLEFARRVGTVVLGTVVVAAALALVGRSVPSMMSGLLVLLTCVALASRQDLPGIFRLLPK